MWWFVTHLFGQRQFKERTRDGECLFEQVFRNAVTRDDQEANLTTGGESTRSASDRLPAASAVAKGPISMIGTGLFIMSNHSLTDTNAHEA